MEDKKVLLSVEDLIVKFKVRGRILTAIRGISLDIYENESIAIVGESAAGKSVFTKTFAGMLDENGYVEQGNIFFSDPELSTTVAPKTASNKNHVESWTAKLNNMSKVEAGADIYKEMLEIKSRLKMDKGLTEEQAAEFEEKLADVNFRKTELYNLKQTISPSKERDRYKEVSAKIKAAADELKALEAAKKAQIEANKKESNGDVEAKDRARLAELNAEYAKVIQGSVSDEVKERNKMIAKEILLASDRYSAGKRSKLRTSLFKDIKKAMQLGVDLNDAKLREKVFDNSSIFVKYESEDDKQYVGSNVVNLAKIKYDEDWTQVRGCRIATVFQDPMTSLNPIITIGKQITSIIIKHQHVSEDEARNRALVLMKKVGIPNAEKRFDDYPFQYSGGMRQRIVIAIALSCQPKILICDEPTTALDVTIQAQILNLIKELQREFNYTIVFITHDLGVVANVADRVAVLYAGQIVEVGKVDEIFYDPRHPYTWALLSSMPQLAQRNTTLYSISGTPPSLYNSIIGDPFAPRNPYCMKIDTVKEPPMFKITDTHYAKTWLEDPRAPKTEKPEAIQNIHEKLMKAFNI